MELYIYSIYSHNSHVHLHKIEIESTYLVIILRYKTKSLALVDIPYDTQLQQIESIIDSMSSGDIPGSTVMPSLTSMSSRMATALATRSGEMDSIIK